MINDKTLTIRLPRKMVQELNRYRLQTASRTGIELSKSEAIRLLLRRGLDATEGNDAPADL